MIIHRSSALGTFGLAYIFFSLGFFHFLPTERRDRQQIPRTPPALSRYDKQFKCMS